MNKLQWNLNPNSYIFIPESAFEKVVWKMAAILCQPRCVNTGSGNGLSPVRHKDITLTKTDLLSTGPLETNFCEIFIKM